MQEALGRRMSEPPADSAAPAAQDVGLPLPPPPPALPPPPPEPYPEPLSPMSEDPGPEDAHRRGTPHGAGPSGTPAVVPSGSGATVMRGRASAAQNAFKFKIVVESTPADIRKAAIEEAIAAANAAAAAAAAEAAAQGGEQGAGGSAQPSSSHPRAGSTAGHTDGAATKRGAGSPEPISRSSKRVRGEEGGRLRQHSSDRRRGSRSRSRSRDPGPSGRGMGRDLSPMDRDRGLYHPPPESPLSGDEGPHGMGNGHLPYGGTGGYGRDMPPYSGRDSGRDRGDGPPAGGWTFEERERHRLERERLDRDGPAHPRDLRDGPGRLEAGVDEVGPLLRRGRLVLVVDLDNTLLASARFGELAPETEGLLVSAWGTLCAGWVLLHGVLHASLLRVGGAICVSRNWRFEELCLYWVQSGCSYA